MAITAVTKRGNRQLVWVMGPPRGTATERFIHTGLPNSPSLKSQRSRSVQHELLESLLSSCKNTSQASSCKHLPFLLSEEQSSLLNIFNTKLFSGLKYHSYDVILSHQWLPMRLRIQEFSFFLIPFSTCLPTHQPPTPLFCPLNSNQSISHLRAFAHAILFLSPAFTWLVSSHPSGVTCSERPCLTTVT